MRMIIAHTFDGSVLNARPDPTRTLGQALFLAGLWSGTPLCAGLGRCGLCRVRFRSVAPLAKVEEERRFSADQLVEGWRLACLHPATTCEVEVPEPPRSPHSRIETDTPDSPLGLAIDLGTTSVHWAALADGVVITQGAALNPQLGLGSEIMTRLAFAAKADGAEILRGRILSHIRTLVAALPGPVTRLAISGNPTMSALLLGLPTAGLATAPYALPDTCGHEYDLGPGLPPAYVAPLFAPFVGADLSAGLVALHFSDAPPKAPFLLADLGTNGEFMLGLKDETLVASVPMGPALEGVGLSFGRTAAPGVITDFQLTPYGPDPVFDLGAPDGPALGMTGTASLSLCALLLRNGLMEPSGQFSSRPTALGHSPMVAKIAARFSTFHGEPAFAITDDIFLTASDVEEILKVKAAFNLAFSTLLTVAQLSVADLSALYLAGAMGEHVNLDDLERLGFLPTGLLKRTHRAGNTSLTGTMLLLTNPEARPWIEALQRPRVLDLAADPDFSGQYLDRMVFHHVS